MMTAGPPPTIAWIGNASTGHLRLLDQTALPTQIEFVLCQKVETVCEAIRSLRVRGAPAIGVAAAYGAVVGSQTALDQTPIRFTERLNEVLDQLAASRPTAVNLFWAVERMRQVGRTLLGMPPAEQIERLLQEARQIEHEDRDMCTAIALAGAPLLAKCEGVLTHCNTGALATAGEGTALAVIFAAHAAGAKFTVYADETRPLLQGARLTAWELLQRNIPTRLICDSMAGWVMKERRVQAVIVGADRITSRGDAANKIGTYSLSILAKAHDIPFYVAAPSSTFDFSLVDGDHIPIEQRVATEITHPLGRQAAPPECPVYNPAFDVAPATHITALITERGVISPVNADEIARVLRPAQAATPIA